VVRPPAIAALIAAVAGSPVAGQSRASDAALAHRIGALVAPQASTGVFSGTILVVRKGATVFEHAYGYASWELRIPNTMATRFGIASITKPMTSVLVELLVKEGRLDLDAPVEKYVPGFPKGPKGGVPTVRQLVDHRAGVPHRVTTPIDETQLVRPADIVERVKTAGLLFEPGTEERYSSAGFSSLARVIEIVAQEPFESTLAKRIFVPAHMTTAISETGQRLMANRALPYLLGSDSGRVAVGSAPYKDLHFLTGAGSVFTTGSDLLHFVEAIHRGVFGAELWRQMFGGDTTAWHGWYGRINGYEASVDVIPGEDLVFVLLTNLQSAANWQLRDQVKHILRDQPTTAIPLPPAVVAPFEPPSSIEGSYGDPKDPIRIVFADGKFYRDGDEFYPIGGHLYYEPVSGSSMRFRRDASGTVDAVLTTFPGGPERIANRIGR
jgi:CubicO group peptidase (beta-lactamase class C family)